MTGYTKMIVAAVTACASMSFGAQILKLDSENYIDPTGNPWLGTWSDTSGQLNDAKSAGWWERPTVIPGGTPTGKPSLQGSTSFKLQLATPVQLTDFTVVTVLKTGSTTDSQVIFGGATTVPESAPGAGDATPGALALRVDGADTGNGRLTLTKVGAWDPVTSNGPLTTGVWHVLSMTYGSGAITMRIDGVAQQLGAAAYITDVGPVRFIGSNSNGSFFQGELAAVYLYNTVLDQTSLTSVENTLTATYVPEPTMLGVVGLTAMGLMRRRSR